MIWPLWWTLSTMPLSPHPIHHWILTPTPSEDTPEEDSEEDYPDSDPMAPPDDMVTELPEEDPDPAMEEANIPDSTTIPLSSVGVQQQTLGAGPPMALPMEPSNLGPALADLDGWA